MKIQSNPWLLIKGGKEVKFRAPFEGMAEILEYWAEKQPEKAAIEFVDVDKSDKSHNDYKKYNWRELKEKVFAAAEMLKRRGLKQGDTIAFGYHNHPNILILSLAAWTGGIRTVPLDLKRDDEEMMKYKLELSGAKVVFGEELDGSPPAILDDISSIRSARDPRSLRRRFSVDIADKLLPSSSSMISEISSSARLGVSLQSEALVLFTSGTTAKPKGAVLTQENLVANADGIADWLEIKSTDKFMIVLPLHHINSTTMSLATLLRGGTIVLVSRYTNSQFFEIAARTGATLSSVVPTIIHDQLARMNQGAGPRYHFLDTLGLGSSLISSSPLGQSESKVLSGSSSMTSKMAPSGQPPDGLRQVRLSRIQLGSAPVVAKEAEEFVKMTGIPLVQGYGQTETALRSTGVEFRDDLSGRYWRNLRSNTIGEEMKWTNVTVMRGEGREGKEGSEGGRQAQEGQEGEICVRGPVIMKKYLKNPAATEDAFKYGWFHSGDLGYWKKVDGKRQFFIKGRIKEIIIKAGVNVSPMAVEEKILKSVPGVDQVYVVGIPDGRVGEEIGAVVVWKRPRMSLDDVFSIRSARNPRSLRRRYQVGIEDKVLPSSSSMISKISSSTHRVVKGLSDFERPKYWFSIRAEKLPMTSTGKVQRVRIREMFKDCAAIAETEKYMFRAISTLEEEMIEAARQMYNRHWAPLAADKMSWEKEIRGRILIGAIDKKTGGLLGWIRVKPEGKTVTADAVTAGGNKNRGIYRNLKEFGGSIAIVEVNKYLNLRIDPVIEFHRRAKAGWEKGAKIVKVVANARPGDTPTLGYGVLMEYPEFSKMPAPRLTDSSLGMMLVEAGLVYAEKRGFKRVRVLSRPVGLWKWIRGEGKENTGRRIRRERRTGRTRPI